MAQGKLDLITIPALPQKTGTPKFLSYFTVSLFTSGHNKNAATCFLSRAHLGGGRRDAFTTAVQYSSQFVLSVIFNVVQSQLTIMNETHEH